MKQKTSLLTAVFLLISLALLSQTKYYKIAEGKVIDTNAYNKMKAEQIEKFKGISGAVKIKESLKEEYQNKEFYFLDIFFPEEYLQKFNPANNIIADINML